MAVWLLVTGMAMQGIYYASLAATPSTERSRPLAQSLERSDLFHRRFALAVYGCRIGILAREDDGTGAAGASRHIIPSEGRV